MSPDTVQGPTAQNWSTLEAKSTEFPYYPWDVAYEMKSRLVTQDLCEFSHLKNMIHSLRVRKL